MELTAYELLEITGGATTSIGTIINSITKLINTVIDLGRTVGSAIRYNKSKLSC